MYFVKKILKNVHHRQLDAAFTLVKRLSPCGDIESKLNALIHFRLIRYINYSI